MSKDKCCGNCKHFENEDIDGFGWCIVALAEVGCNHCCPNHEFNNNGWTEITPDNVDELYERPVVVAWEYEGKSYYRLMGDCMVAPSTMAKNGGYYYYTLPELKIG